MRIACLYLPSLPLQAFLRGSPRWIGAPVAVLDGHRRVLACSRAAWTAGVRPGMTGLAAHETCPGLIAAARPSSDAVVHALGDALLAIADRVDLGASTESGAHHALYLEVPRGTRGATFGARLLEVASAQGLRARVGIADDRFTAWVAASTATETDVVSVPRGGSAVFLAPRPLSLLAIPPEVQHVLAVVGVRTLGEFATLPPPSPQVSWDADYQALARGDGGASLAPFTPTGAVVERVEIGGEIGIAAALERTATRIAARLAGRGRAAALVIARTGNATIPVTVAANDAGDLADAVGRALTDVTATGFVELEVTSTVPRDDAAVPVAVAVETSAPILEASPPPVFALTPPEATISRLATLAPASREHRRTRRGKDRPRPALQGALFAKRA